MDHCPECGSERVDWYYDSIHELEKGECLECGCEFAVIEEIEILKHGEQEVD